MSLLRGFGRLLKCDLARVLGGILVEARISQIIEGAVTELGFDLVRVQFSGGQAAELPETRYMKKADRAKRRSSWFLFQRRDVAA